jgi:hypothetical protein
VFKGGLKGASRLPGGRRFGAGKGRKGMGGGLIFPILQYLVDILGRMNKGNSIGSIRAGIFSELAISNLLLGVIVLLIVAIFAYDNAKHPSLLKNWGRHLRLPA